jgi:hypothetical protein
MAKLITKKEYRKRRLRYQIAAGLVDFLVTVACAALVLMCVTLIIELVAWLKSDVPVSFGEFFTIGERVLHMNGG